MRIDSGPVIIAVISEFCQLLKIYLLMRIVSDYSGMSVARLIPGKKLGVILLASGIAGMSSYLIIRLLSVNKFILLALALALFCVIYYVMCRVLKIKYKEIVSDLLGEYVSPSLLKLIP